MLRNLLTDVAGIAVGHAEDLDLCSGVTAIVFDRPAVAAVSVLGGAPGGRDTDMLAPHNTIEAVDAIVLSGGSAFGLDAAGGVQAALREQGRGLVVRRGGRSKDRPGGHPNDRDVRVPIVSQAARPTTGAGSRPTASWVMRRHARLDGTSRLAARVRAPVRRRRP